MPIAERLLNLLPHEDQGWKQLDETFIRYRLLECRFFRVYVHKLIAPMAHDHCHDHPWSFLTILLLGGYFELAPDTAGEWVWRKPGSVLYRPHGWLHNVTTYGTSWSLVLTGPKRYKWGFRHCGKGADEAEAGTPPRP